MCLTGAWANRCPWNLIPAHRATYASVSLRYGLTGCERWLGAVRGARTGASRTSAL
jgi:hypothetical protein